MSLPGRRLFRDGAILTLFSKYAWYRKSGYPHASAAVKARWRAGLSPAHPSEESGAIIFHAVPAKEVPVYR